MTLLNSRAANWHRTQTQGWGPNGQKRVTVGRHPLIGAGQARQRAALIITRIKSGEDPVPLPIAAKFAAGPTVTDLARHTFNRRARNLPWPRPPVSTASAARNRPLPLPLPLRLRLLATDPSLFLILAP